MEELEALLNDPACKLQMENIIKVLELYKGGFVWCPGKDVWLAQG